MRRGHDARPPRRPGSDGPVEPDVAASADVVAVGGEDGGGWSAGGGDGGGCDGDCSPARARTSRTSRPPPPLPPSRGSTC